jgi:DNA-binding SARP family transcriptional activator
LRLAELREALGDRLVTTRSSVTLLLPPDAWVDVAVAEQAALAAEVSFGAGDAEGAFRNARTAVKLLAQPYLPEFDDASVRQRRQQFEDVRSATQHRLAAAALALDPPDGVAAAERAAAELTARQPYRQSGYRLLMEALARQGAGPRRSTSSTSSSGASGMSLVPSPAPRSAACARGWCRAKANRYEPRRRTRRAQCRCRWGWRGSSGARS